MLLLTGATGLVGSALLRRLVAGGEPVRCLVRDPRRLGRAARARADRAGRPRRPAFVSQRAARREDGRAPGGVDPRPARRLDRGAQRDRDLAHGRVGRARRRRALRVLLRARTRRPTTAPACSAPRRSPSRPCARRALHSIVFAPSIVYAPGDPWLTLLERLALLPVMPVSGRGRALLPADLGRGRRRLRDDRAGAARPARPRRRAARALRAGRTRHPQPHARSCGLVLRALGRRRPLVHVPPRSSRAACARWRRSPGSRAVRHLGRGRADGGADDLRHGIADAERLGVGRSRWPPCSAWAEARPRARDARQPTSGGRRSAHGRAASSWADSASSAPSRAGRPTSCTPSGRPSSP